MRSIVPVRAAVTPEDQAFYRQLGQRIAELLEEPIPKGTSRRGPTPTLQRQLEQVALLPRARQKMINEMLEALINQQQAS